MNQILYKGEIFGGVGEDVTNKQHTITLDGQELETIGGKNSEIFNSYKDEEYNYRNICEGDNSTVIGEGNKALKYKKVDNTWIRDSNSLSRNFIGGKDNLVIGNNSNSIIVGQSNQIIKDGESNAVFGHANTLKHNSINYTLISGQGNTVYSSTYTVVGGQRNCVSGSCTAVFGEGNRIGIDNSGEYLSTITRSFVSGYENIIINSGEINVLGVRNSIYSTNQGALICGYENNVKESHASLISGLNNKIKACFQCIIGGNNNEVSGEYALICGNNLKCKNVYYSIFTGKNNEGNAIYYSLIGNQDSKLEEVYHLISTGPDCILSGKNETSLCLGQSLKINNGKDNVAFGNNNSIHGKQNFIFGKDNQLGIYEGRILGTTYDTLQTLNTLQQETVTIDGVSQTINYHKLNFNKEIEREFTLGTYTSEGTQFDNRCCVARYNKNTSLCLGLYVWDDESEPGHPHWNNGISSVGKIVIGRTYEDLSNSDIAYSTSLLVYDYAENPQIFKEELSENNAGRPEGMGHKDQYFGVGDIVRSFTKKYDKQDTYLGTYIFNGKEWEDYNEYNYKQYYSSNNIILGNKNYIIPDTSSYIVSKADPPNKNLDKQYGNNLILFSDKNNLENSKNNILINSYGLTLNSSTASLLEDNIKTKGNIIINFNNNDNNNLIDAIQDTKNVFNFGNNKLNSVRDSFIFQTQTGDSEYKNSITSALNSFIFGSKNNVTNMYSYNIIFGSENTTSNISGGNSWIFGSKNTNSSIGAYSFGNENEFLNSVTSCYSLGNKNKFLQGVSFYSFGDKNILSSGSYFYGLGSRLEINNNSYAVAIGYLNKNTSGTSFVIGNGTSEWNDHDEEIITRSNSFEVYKDGCQSIILKDKVLSNTLGIGKIEIAQEKVKFTSLKDNSNNEKETIEFTFEELKALKTLSGTQNINNTQFPQN